MSLVFLVSFSKKLRSETHTDPKTLCVIVCDFDPALVHTSMFAMSQSESNPVF